jgi:hypothetical protein
MVRMNLPALRAARDELLARDLLAHEARFTRVLSLPLDSQHRRREPGAGLMRLGKILRRAVELPRTHNERSSP